MKPTRNVDLRVELGDSHSTKEKRPGIERGKACRSNTRPVKSFRSLATGLPIGSQGQPRVWGITRACQKKLDSPGLQSSSDPSGSQFDPSSCEDPNGSLFDPRSS
jgi:hypothetical protein